MFDLLKPTVIVVSNEKAVVEILLRISADNTYGEQLLFYKNLSDVVNNKSLSNVKLLIASVGGSEDLSLYDLLDVPMLLIVNMIECNDGIFENRSVNDFEIIFKPFTEDEFRFRYYHILKKALNNRGEKIKDTLYEKHVKSLLISNSPSLKRILSTISRIAKSEISVLITGETGVGKELCARALHYLSHRAVKPFVSVNSSAIPVNLFESEIFGHTKGSFTGAESNKIGIVQEASGGTLFLDELDTLDYNSQSKLLRLLQENEFRPVGATNNEKANIRFIAATNKDIRKMIQAGQFREDLYYRLNYTLNVPPLRERKEDLDYLIDYYLAKYLKEFELSPKKLTSTARRLLHVYDWPGNIRELDNVMRMGVIMSSGSEIVPEDLALCALEVNKKMLSFQEAKKQAVEEFESNYLKNLMIKCGGNISVAAKRCNKDRADISKMVKKYFL